MGAIQADQDTSFQAMDRILRKMVDIVAADPAVDTVNGFTGGGTAEHGPHVRHPEASGRARDHGGRSHRPPAAEARAHPRRHALPAGLPGPPRRRTHSNAQYQFTMRGDNLDDLMKYAPLMLRELRTVPAHRRRQQRPAEPAACRLASSTTARPPPASASRRS